jgi:hypothetical protein
MTTNMAADQAKYFVLGRLIGQNENVPSIWTNQSTRRKFSKQGKYLGQQWQTAA